MRHFVVKDKSGNIISAVSEQDAEDSDHSVQISVVIPSGFNKEAVSEDEYKKQKKSLASKSATKSQSQTDHNQGNASGDVNQ